MNNTTIL